jgi:regulatory protein
MAERKRTTARQAALRLLAARALSERELEERLARKGFEPAEVSAVVSAMRRAGYVDDRKLAYNVISSRSKRARIGRGRLEAELGRRGISPRDRQSAWEMARDEFDEQALLAQAIQVLLEREGPPRDIRAYERLAQRLARRGFAARDVLRALAPHRPPGAETDDIV